MNKFHLTLTLFLLLVFSCGETSIESSDESETLLEQLTISTEFLDINIGSESFSQTISFTTTVDWEIFILDSSVPSEWISFSENDGGAGTITLTIDIEENKDTEDRIAQVVILAGSADAVITISQDSFSPSLAVSKKSEEVSNEAGAFTFDITSNTDWVISNIPDWITLGSTTGDSDETVTVSYSANETTESRVGTFTITANDLKETITVTQSGTTPTLSLSTESESVAAEEGAFTLDITSNTDWSITNIPDWITLSSITGNGDKTVTVSYSANKTYDERVGTFTVKSDEITLTVSVTQAGEVFVATLSISRTDETVDCGSGSFSFNIISNTDWTITNIPDWITLSAVNGSGNESVTVSYSANETYDARSQTLTVSVSGITKELKVTQSGVIFVATLSVDKTSESVAEQSGSFAINITSNSDWSISNIPSWITLSAESGNGDKTVTVSYSANETSYERSGSFDISTDGVTVTITVNQAVGTPVTPTDPEINDWEKDTDN